jgi:hypothetical protein
MCFQEAVAQKAQGNCLTIAVKQGAEILGGLAPVSHQQQGALALA